VPAEGNWPIPAQLRVRACTLREAEGYLWLWRGPAASTEALPALPRQPSLDGLCWGETRSTWPAHYTRCIENVIDYSHLPFVHRRNLGLFNRDPVTRVRVDARPGGFLFFRLDDKPGRQFVDFTYPTLWLNTLGDRFHLAATFVPIDDDHTEVYVRWYHPWDWPGIRALVDVYGRWSQKIVFRDDLPIVASQQPRNVDDADSDHLVPSDAALLAFRRLRRQHQQETRQAQGIDLP
jgi:phenylpropionate dioxygenase-like ring-hydroxylating dioxygenase large terminal subunit